MHGYITIAFVHSFGLDGTGFDTGSLDTMIAEGRYEVHPDIGELTYGFRLFARPGSTCLNVVFALAADDTSATAGASLHVDNHSKLFALQGNLTLFDLGAGNIGSNSQTSHAGPDSAHKTSARHFSSHKGFFPFIRFLHA